jgi:hypothetical protein
MRRHLFRLAQLPRSYAWQVYGHGLLLVLLLDPPATFHLRSTGGFLRLRSALIILDPDYRTAAGLLGPGRRGSRLRCRRRCCLLPRCRRCHVAPSNTSRGNCDDLLGSRALFDGVTWGDGVAWRLAPMGAGPLLVFFGRPARCVYRAKSHVLQPGYRGWLRGTLRQVPAYSAEHREDHD